MNLKYVIIIFWFKTWKTVKKLLLFLILIASLRSAQLKAQDNGATATIAAVGALTAIGAGVVAIQQMKESAELRATEWILANHPDMTSFALKTLDFDGKKLKDMSATSVISFKIQEFTPSDKPDIDGKKYILFGFTSHGWISQYGINFDKVKWYLIDKTEWLKMMTAYVKVASDKKNEQYIHDELLKGRIVNTGVKQGAKLTIPFFKLTGDMYVIADYSPEMKIIYNERSLGIYLKETQDLVQIGRGDIISIHEFFLGNE